MKKYIKQLLREGLIDEGTITLPNEVTTKFGVLYDLIKSKYDDYANAILNRKYNNPYIAFKDYFKLNDRANKPLSVDIGLYDDKTDAGSGRMDTVNDVLLINLSTFNDFDTKSFENILYHELVHAMDPLVRDVKIFGDYYAKKGAEPSGNKFALSKNNPKSEYDQNMEKYKQSQHEYTAFLSPLVAEIKKITGGDTNKLKWITWIIQNIKHFKTAEELYTNTVSHLDDMIAIKLFNDNNSYWRFIYALFNDAKEWTTDETIYKKFINDLYKGVTK